MNRRAAAFCLLALVMGAMPACSSPQEPSAPAHEHAHHTTDNGDIQELTASLEKLPSFLDKLPEQIGQIYGVAAAHIPLLEQMPCYCGCGDSAGHRSNLNCFIKEVQSDGSVVWDDHATRCGVCLEIALKAAQWQRQGKSDQEIRTAIDALYKEGYAEPTPTPVPS